MISIIKQTSSSFSVKSFQKKFKFQTVKKETRGRKKNILHLYQILFKSSFIYVYKSLLWIIYPFSGDLL